MANRYVRPSFPGTLSVFVFLNLLTDLCGVGLPEPNLVYYGIISDASGKTITEGELAWRFTSQTDGRQVVLRTDLSAVNGQFSFVLPIAAEMPLAGAPVSESAIALRPSPTEYDQSEVFLNETPLFLTDSSQASTTLSSLDRGRIIRIDLSLNEAIPSGDNDLLLDDWERRFFGDLSATENGDPDGDGAPNLSEQRAGTDPTDPDSVFAFTLVSTDANGQLTVEWLSAAGQSYTLLRANAPNGNFVPIASQLKATPPTNRFTDETATESSGYFYLLEAQPLNP